MATTLDESIATALETARRELQEVQATTVAGLIRCRELAMGINGCENHLSIDVTDFSCIRKLYRDAFQGGLITRRRDDDLRGRRTVHDE